MNEGRKDDVGKIQPSIVLGDFSRALTEVCKAGETGIQRYGPSNWLNVPNARKRYEDALLRHWLSSKTEQLDQDSELLHLAHVAWNALAVLELELGGLEQPQEQLLSKFKTEERPLRDRLSEEDKIKIQKETRGILEEKIRQLESEIANGRTRP